MILARVFAIEPDNYDGCASCADGKREIDFADEVPSIEHPLWICKGCAAELRRERSGAMPHQHHIGWTKRAESEWYEEDVTQGRLFRGEDC